MTGIIDYGAGNTASVSYALEKLGVDLIISSSVEELERCDSIILPGVGSARAAMDNLRARGLTEFIKTTGKPFLGICLGMQLLAESSEEGETECLGIVKGSCTSFDKTVSKVPLMGWNRVEVTVSDPIFDGIEPGSYFYFAHSFKLPVITETIAKSDNSGTYTAALRKGNMWGVQFHPEKSSDQGLRLLKNFIEKGGAA
ncbi:MAG: imidazole glycerol phosphate synthase subunit HisH [Ignavibacteriaceae bacterium]|nr:MAG: imidazole glycerol phosphate synthase subunit HisH [Chlorobiota bacterium]GJQ32165.1 MAG: imidazole glycerol phosphate synthase subunit HisH [Ignavibacteriaceae bacterium]